MLFSVKKALRSWSLLLNLISTVHAVTDYATNKSKGTLNCPWTHPKCYAFLTSSLLITIVFTHLLGQGIGSFWHSSKWLWNTYNNLVKGGTTAGSLKVTASLHLWSFMPFFRSLQITLKIKLKDANETRDDFWFSVISEGFCGVTVVFILFCGEFRHFLLFLYIWLFAT